MGHSVPHKDSKIDAEAEEEDRPFEPEGGEEGDEAGSQSPHRRSIGYGHREGTHGKAEAGNLRRHLQLPASRLRQGHGDGGGGERGGKGGKGERGRRRRGRRRRRRRRRRRARKKRKRRMKMRRKRTM